MKETADTRWERSWNWPLAGLLLAALLVLTLGQTVHAQQDEATGVIVKSGGWRSGRIPV